MGWLEIFIKFKRLNLTRNLLPFCRPSGQGFFILFYVYSSDHPEIKLGVAARWDARQRVGGGCQGKSGGAATRAGRGLTVWERKKHRKISLKGADTGILISWSHLYIYIYIYVAIFFLLSFFGYHLIPLLMFGCVYWDLRFIHAGFEFAFIGLMFDSYLVLYPLFVRSHMRYWHLRFDFCFKSHFENCFDPPPTFWASLTDTWSSRIHGSHAKVASISYLSSSRAHTRSIPISPTIQPLLFFFCLYISSYPTPKDQQLQGRRTKWRHGKQHHPCASWFSWQWQACFTPRHSRWSARTKPTSFWPPRASSRRTSATPSTSCTTSLPPPVFNPEIKIKTGWDHFWSLKWISWAMVSVCGPKLIHVGLKPYLLSLGLTSLYSSWALCEWAPLQAIWCLVLLYFMGLYKISIPQVPFQNSFI